MWCGQGCIDGSAVWCGKGVLRCCVWCGQGCIETGTVVRASLC